MANPDLPLIKGSYIDGLASNLLLSRVPSTEIPSSLPRDDQWRKQSFITATPTDKWENLAFLINVNLDQIDIDNRKFSSATFKYTDSSLGGNDCINPPPQFTRYADIRDKGMRKSSAITTVAQTRGDADIGMGRYYSEAIDDNNQVIHMRFGVPQYNSLTQFFTGFYSSSASNMARTGRVDQTFIEKFLGAAGKIIALAVLPLAIIPIGIMMMGTAIRFFMNWPSSKFYYLKPAMPLYWQAVSSMVNQIGVNKGVIKYMNQNQDSYVNKPHNHQTAEYSMFNSAFTEFGSDGVINVLGIANRAKRLEMRHRTAMQEAYDKLKPEENWYGTVRNLMDDGGGLDKPTPKETKFTLESYLQSWIDSPMGKKEGNDDKSNSQIEKDIRESKSTAGLTPEQIKAAQAKPEPANTNDGFLTHWLSEEAEGSQWASFRVDYTGPVGESFNNSVGESSLAQKLNSASSSARDVRINFADGNVDGMGVVSTLIGGVSTILQGAADVFQLGGMAAFAGNSFVDIPKHWESSSASLTKTSYTLTLISPYGNPVSQMFSIYIPLCMLLAGALPLATGKQSYTAPFLCELYDRGRAITRLGIIDSISIQRGTANLGFNNEGQPMAIEVSFGVMDLSSIVAMPISQGFSINPLEGMFDTENSFSDYLMALSSLSLRDATQRWPMLKNAFAKKRADMNVFFSAANFGTIAANLPGVNLLSAILRGTELK